MMKFCILLLASGLMTSSHLLADSKVWTQENSNPLVFKWMEGSPPAEDKTIRFTDGDYFNFPKMRWTVCNFQALMPSKSVSRGLVNPIFFSKEINEDIDQLRFIPLNQTKSMTWRESLDVNFTDSIIVLHRGKIIYEYYNGCMDENKKHGAMSVSKSFTGLLGEILIAQGILDESAKVSSYVPELAKSAFGDATIRELLDMTTGLLYSEDYADPNAQVWQHAAAGSPLPKPKGYKGPRTYYEFLQTVKKDGKHGEFFHYKTINTDALGWVISRVAKKPLADLLSEKIWSRIGQEQEAFYTVDSIGTPFAGGGLNLGARDLARVGELLLNEGKVYGNQVIPKAVVDSIKKGGNKTAFKKSGYDLLPNWSYRSMFWITHNDHGAFMARGVHGQALYVDPKAQMVIARFSSHPKAANAGNDPTSLPAYHELAKMLLKQGIDE